MKEVFLDDADCRVTRKKNRIRISLDSFAAEGLADIIRHRTLGVNDEGWSALSKALEEAAICD